MNDSHSTPLVIRKIQITATIRFHFTYSWMAKIKKTYFNKFDKGMKNWNPCTLLVEMYTVASDFGNQAGSSSRRSSKHSYHMTQHFNSQVYTKRNENIRPYKNLYTNIPKNITHLGKKKKRWKQPKGLSTDEWINKYVIFTQWGIIWQ